MRAGQDDLEALTSMVRILMRGRPRSAKLEDLAELQRRFDHLAPFTAPLTLTASPVDRRLRLAADLAAWLPAGEDELRRAKLPTDAAGRTLVARALTGDEAVDVTRRRLPRSWDSDAKIDWSRDEALRYLRRASAQIAAALLDPPAAMASGHTEIPPSADAQYSLLLAINTVRLEGRTIVHRDWYRRVQITTDERVRGLVTRRGADGFSVEVTDPVGCTVARRTPVSTHTFQFELELPAGLRRGQTHTYSYRMKDTNVGEVINQFLASAGDQTDSPKELIVRVQFDPTDLPSRVWMIEGLKFATLPDDPDSHRPCELRDYYAEAVFTDTIPLRMYAICWQWD